MNITQKDFIRIADDVYVYRGAVNTGVLINKNRAVLIDCCDSLEIGELRKLGVDTIETILFTQHRRTHTAGAYQFIGKAKIIVPQKDKHLFEGAEAYWQNLRNRWHLYHYQPGPLVMTKNLPVTGTVSEGDIMKWEKFVIEVLETPGATDGSVSYIVTSDGLNICFSGDVIYGNGQILDLYSLQKGFTTKDYHGFMGNVISLVGSMEKLKAKADMLIPSHGDFICDRVESLSETIDSLKELYENYCSISSVNYYFPDCLRDIYSSTEVMKPAECAGLPDFIRHVEFTTFAVIADNGAALVVDCGSEKVIEELRGWMQQGIIRTVEACWVTHYHDDHVDYIRRLASSFLCPVMTTEYVAEIIEHPDSYFLPCISPNSVHVDTIMPDGYSWRWNEFTLTAMHLPGQTLYHGGLLVEGNGQKVLLAGDSFSPNGIDDYCSGNRNFSGEGRGYRYCIDVLRRYKPDYILNQHQLKVFRMTERDLEFMEKKLIEREKILSRILPWHDPNFGLDEWWVRTYPYEQKARPGCCITIETHFTNHGSRQMTAAAMPILPKGWDMEYGGDCKETIVPAFTSGSVNISNNDQKPDVRIPFTIRIPNDALDGTYMVNFRITMDNSYLGQFRHAIVHVVRGSEGEQVD